MKFRDMRKEDVRLISFEVRFEKSKIFRKKAGIAIKRRELVVINKGKSQTKLRGW